jgi:hypothetical protein
MGEKGCATKKSNNFDPFQLIEIACWAAKLSVDQNKFFFLVWPPNHFQRYETESKQVLFRPLNLHYKANDGYYLSS